MRPILITAAVLGGLLSSITFATPSMTASVNQPVIANNVQVDGSIDINQADATTLEELHGLAEVKAKAIVDYRSDHGPFQSVDELDHVRGIGPQLIAKLKAKNPGRLVCSGAA